MEEQESNKKETANCQSKFERLVMPDFILKATPDCTCVGCYFTEEDSSRCDRPDELDCFDDKTGQDFIFEKKA